MQKKIPVGISSCLLGHNVRYNGGHKQSKFCLDHLSKVFAFEAFCPEVAIGLGIPREPIRMVDSVENPRVVGTVNSDVDVTEPLFNYGREIGVYSRQLSGYILMKNSPSCGLLSAKIYNQKANFPGKHAGMFVRGLQATNPLLPLEEDGRLNDAVLRENFIARVFAYDFWRNSVADAPTAHKLVQFHSRYKYLLMAHNQQAYRALGRIVAEAGLNDPAELAQTYIQQFMATITKPATRKGHSNTLYHLLGYLRENVPGNIRQELVNKIEDYRKGIINLAVPMALLQHYLQLHGSDYVQSQAYLQPHSYDLGLRNDI